MAESPRWSKVKRILDWPAHRAANIAELLNLGRQQVRKNGLDLPQTELAWLCRYSNMRYHQEREKRYKP